MANRRRPIPKRIWFTEEEWHLVEAKMVEAEMTNFSAFGLEMLLHGEVRHYDFSNLKQLNASMGRIAGSINQIAKRCNVTIKLGKPQLRFSRRPTVCLSKTTWHSSRARV